MKVVKITRQWKQWNSGHRVALRFQTYNDQARAAEKIARETLETGGWDRHGDYYSWFGARCGRDSYRPYFISFRDEKMLAFVLLRADLTPK